MPIVASEGQSGTIYTHPEGQFAGRCIDIIDLGMVETTFQGNTKKQRKVVVRFFCGEFTDDNKPLYIGRRFTLSLNEKSSLRPFLKTWRGREFTADELKAFDLENLIGVDGFLQISHSTKDGRTYANIDSVIRLPKGVEKAPPLDGYVRAVDRTEEEHKEEQKQGYKEPGEEWAGNGDDDPDSDLPF